MLTLRIYSADTPKSENETMVDDKYIAEKLAEEEAFQKGKTRIPHVWGSVVGNRKFNRFSKLSDDHIAYIKKIAPKSIQERYTTWYEFNKEKGKWDFSDLDGQLKILKKFDFPWQAFLIASPQYAAPAWATKNATRYKCLAHDQYSEVISLWDPEHKKQIEEFLKRFYRRYGKNSGLVSTMLGITGIYGEAIYLGQAKGWPGNYHSHNGYWVGDKYAQASFKRFVKAKYGNIGKLNDVWGTSYKSFEGVKPFLYKDRPSTAAWLDFMNFYQKSMTEFAEFWIKTALKYKPEDIELVLCCGGQQINRLGNNYPMLVKLCARYGVEVRLTNEGDGFAKNWAKTRIVNTLCRYYGIPYSPEPATLTTPFAIASRIALATSSGASYWHCYEHYLSKRGEPDETRTPQYLDNRKFLINKKPLIDVGILTVKEKNLTDDTGKHWHVYNSKIEVLRDFFDAELLDPGSIYAGVLDKLKILLIVHSPVISKKTERKIINWVNKGGVLVVIHHDEIVDFEGKNGFIERIFGKPEMPLESKEYFDLTYSSPKKDKIKKISIDYQVLKEKYARKSGKGHIFYFPYSWKTGKYGFGAFVNEVRTDLNNLTGKPGLPVIDELPDNIYATQFHDAILLFNENDFDVKIKLNFPVSDGIFKPSKVNGRTVTIIKNGICYIDLKTGKITCSKERL